MHDQAPQKAWTGLALQFSREPFVPIDKEHRTEEGATLSREGLENRPEQSKLDGRIDEAESLE
jgi:hypothetical protein